MKKALILSFCMLVLLGITKTSFAICYSSGNKYAPTIQIDLSDQFYSQTIIERSLVTQFTGDLNCTSYSNKITNVSPLKEKRLVVGFSNGRYPVELRIYDLNPTNISLSSGRIATAKVQANFVFSARPVPNQRTDINVPGSTYKLDKAIISADTSRIGLLELIRRIFLYILGKWDGSEEGELLYQPIEVTYHPRETTCTFDNADLVVNLPEINRTQLARNKSAGVTRFHLDFTCKNLINGQVSRPVKAYLSSNQVYSGDKKTLIDNSPFAAKGVGIRINRYADTNDVSTLEIALPGKTPNDKSYIFNYGSKRFMEKTFGENLWAYYYVYDPKNLTGGKISATAILNFEYN